MLNALEEVEKALAGLSNASARRQSIAKTVEPDRMAADLARDRYRHGLTSRIDVLSAERNFAQDRQQLAAAVVAETTTLIALYKALGGGWQEGPAQPANSGS